MTGPKLNEKSFVAGERSGTKATAKYVRASASKARVVLDLIRGLVRELNLAAVIVTHDLAVARLLATRMIVMQRGRVIEAGLSDQVLEDPQAPYTQLLVSSVLQV